MEAQPAKHKFRKVPKILLVTGSRRLEREPAVVPEHAAAEGEAPAKRVAAEGEAAAEGVLVHVAAAAAGAAQAVEQALLHAQLLLVQLHAEVGKVLLVRMLMLLVLELRRPVAAGKGLRVAQAARLARL